MTTEWASINAALADLSKRTERLDAHSAEMAQELLDVIQRVDDLEQRLSDRIERITARLEASIERSARELDNHLGDHWRSGR